MSTPRPARRLGRLGGLGVWVAFSILPLTLVAGTAIDLTRLFLLQSRLVAATDAAALAGARAIFDSDRDAQVRRWFWTNFTRASSDGNIGYLGANVPPATFTITTEDNSKVLRVRVKATLPTAMMRLVGIDAMTVGADQAARRQDRGMELAMVLDVTGSMNDYAGATRKIVALRNAATELLRILFGNNETVENLWVSLVPYTATVNIGSARAAWLDPDDTRRFNNATWRGCVEARREGDDVTDAPPSAAGRRYRRFFYASTYGLYGSNRGDNDWTTGGSNGTAINEVNPENTTATSPDSTSYHPNGANERGPNLTCERAVTFSSGSRSLLMGEVARLRAGPDRGGTVSAIGVQVGWGTLSPRWRGQWGVSSRPLDYRTPNMDKIMIIMTDGRNQIADGNGAPGYCSRDTVDSRGRVTSTSWCRANYEDDDDTDYTAYGRLREGRLGTTNEARATTAIDTRTAQLCASMKQAGITIYTITFAVASTTARDLFRNCASRPDYYFDSPDSTALQGAFREIGQQLANLRLVR